MKVKLSFLLSSLIFALMISSANAQEIGVSPDPLPAINEGDKITFSVTVKNVGTEGTISVSVSSESYSFTPLTSSGKTMEAGEVATFKWEAHALNVEGDKETTIEILAQGRGGTSTYTLKGKILDVPGYSPEIPPSKGTSPTPLWIYFTIAILLIIGVGIATIIWTKRKKSLFSAEFS